MMISIVGSRTGFRVVLDSEEWLLAMGHGRNRAVVQIEMGDLHGIWEGVGVEGEPVVLAGDLNLTCCSARVIETAMTEIKFEG